MEDENRRARISTRWRKYTKRTRRVVAVSGLVVLLVSTAAIAAWVAEGSGTGTWTENTGNQANQAITVQGTNQTDGLTPGGSAKGQTIVIFDPSSTAAQVSSVVISVASTSAGAACPPSDFTVTQGTWSNGTAAQTLPYTLPASATSSTTGDLTSTGTGAVEPTVQLVSAAPLTCANNVTVNLQAVVS